MNFVNVLCTCYFYQSNQISLDISLFNSFLLLVAFNNSINLVPLFVLCFILVGSLKSGAKEQCFTHIFSLIVLLLICSLCICLQPIFSTQQKIAAVAASSPITDTPTKAHKKIEIPLICSDINVTQTCPVDYPQKVELDPDVSPPSTCPEYFRWIYEDLQPWKQTGITREMVESAKRTANFRLVISNGKAYVERYKKSWQTRDVFTLWGFLQLLRKYPGRVPDLELMFDCVDWPVISKRFSWPNNTAPPLFRYCGDDKTLDIVFPDWSFWGW